MKRIVFISLLFSLNIFAQTDWVKWKAAQLDYAIRDSDVLGEEKKVENGEGVLNEVRNLYAFFISDLDGDNCPFYPSCSHFFAEAVSETNLFQGILMFGDRFVRDTNFFKTKAEYPSKVKGRFYDPVFLYELKKSKINIFRWKNPFAASGIGEDR